MKDEEHDRRHADLDEVLPVLHLLVVDVVLPHSGAGLVKVALTELFFKPFVDFCHVLRHII